MLLFQLYCLCVCLPFLLLVDFQVFNSKKVEQVHKELTKVLKTNLHPKLPRLVFTDFSCVCDSDFAGVEPPEGLEYNDNADCLALFDDKGYVLDLLDEEM